MIARIALMAEMVDHFDFESPLNQHLGKLLEHPVLANEMFGFLVVRH